jgi:17beta-estradiol 17-dehydrogenase / very-long-chain 3-oxoacyl-CoA reductase
MVKAGSWAIVTGSTDGIGKEFAEQLAALGCNICLVSRTMEKLEQVAEELTEKYKVKCQICQADLCQPLFEEVEIQLRNLKANILVNNAGMSYQYADYLENLDSQRINNMVAINCTQLTQLTKLVLPHMKKSKQGIILNVGSGTSRLSCGSPLYTVYAATKAFVEVFSRSLDFELRSTKIKVCCVTPYYVSTKISRMKPRLDVPTPKSFVKDTLNCSPRIVLVPNKIHFLMDCLLTWLPISSIILKINKSIRRRALNKLAREEGEDERKENWEEVKKNEEEEKKDQ